MAYTKDNINFVQLEKDLQKVINDDQRYWKENDAKMRAVEQRVPTYEQFRDMVKAAHLTPLKKGEKLDIKSKIVWNPFANAKKNAMKKMDKRREANVQNQVRKENNLPKSYQELHKQWTGQCGNDEQRYQLLTSVGLTRLQQLIEGEMNFGILGDVLQTLAVFTVTIEDVVFAVKLLEIVSRTQRFNLTLQFLNASEKSKCSQLLQLLHNKLNENQQDLAERGITEWTLHTLRLKYRIPSC